MEAVRRITWVSDAETLTTQLPSTASAFSLGETASHDIIPALKDAAKNDSSAIVKHESLLALGTIAAEECIPFLAEMEKEKARLISESAKVALQRIKYVDHPYRGPEEFAHLKN